jgi:hypothetical protein
MASPGNCHSRVLQWRWSHDLAADKAVVFSDVALINICHGGLIESQAAIVDDGRILQGGPGDQVVLQDKVKVIDGRGHYLMPGLAEMYGMMPLFYHLAGQDLLVAFVLAAGIMAVGHFAPMTVQEKVITRVECDYGLV